MITYQLKQTLGELATARAEFIDHETNLIRSNVKVMARVMTHIANHPEEYKPVAVVDPRNSSVKMGETYVIYAPDLKKNLTPKIQNDILIAGNIRTLLMPIAKSFAAYKSSFYVGSKDGWFICSSIFPGEEFSPVTDDELYKYDPRKRPWYINAISAGAPVFSDLYTNIDTDEYQLLGCSAPYYDKDGVAGVVGLDVSSVDIYKAIEETAVGANGFSFVLNNKGEIIFSSRKEGVLVATSGGDDLRQTSEKSLSDAAQNMVEGQSGILPVIVDGEEYFLAFEPLQSVDWSFGALIKVSEVTAPADAVAKSIDSQTDDFISSTENFSLKLLPLMAVAFAILLAAVSILSKRVTKSIVKPIHQLADGVREISSGNLDKKLDINTGDEIEHLAVCFNAKETAENERISTELNVATNIQQSMLPHDFPSRADCELYATMHAAKEVGGDFYDFYFLDENHLVITIADVSGKGVPAALFMAISKTILQNFALSMKNPDDFSAVMTLANQQLCQNNDEMLFVTVFMGMLDLKTGEFIYVNGGHNPPLVCRENKFEYLDVGKSCMLGIDEDVPFPQKKIKLASGDMIFLYTDGVTEAMNERGELFGEDYLHEVLNREDKSESLEILLENMRRAIKIHAGDAEQSDDITMLALKWNGGKKIDG